MFEDRSLHVGVAAQPMNCPPAGVDVRERLPADLFDLLVPIAGEFTARQRSLIRRRADRLAASQHGRRPDHLRASEATTGGWRVWLPEWCQDQRNQMTGPADDVELVVKMLNSGAPGVMIDLEDSMVNRWDRLLVGHRNAVDALHGTLRYYDSKRGRNVSINPSSTVVSVRVRGLHMSQAGILPEGPVPAPLFDLALLVASLDPGAMKHPLCIYIPKSESADEALWWRDLFRRIATLKGWPRDAITCMALVESHPLAYEIEEFLYHLRDHVLALNLGRWDYMASLLDYTMDSGAWVLPDRNTIPHDVPFFQRLRTLLPEICHRRGVLAIGGMTALYPSRVDPELNARALAVLEMDKRNEAEALMDGAWTGHPDQNAIAVAQFPYPNQMHRRPEGLDRYPDLRPEPNGIGRRTVAGTRAAARVTTLYRFGVLKGRGASLVDGYMEDLATDRIYRLMLAQRMRQRDAVPVVDDAGRPVAHTAEFVTRIYDEELEKISDGAAPEDRALYAEARRQSQQMIVNGWHTPV